ncbi:MFS transporter, partial [Croceibacter atlanticus]|nr:MFS transporter [Croceibacter atlanticus]
AARVAQGLGAAAVMSVNTALLRHIYPSKMLGRGLGYNSLVVGLAFTLGPTAASAILSVATWHWLYLINVPLGLLALGLGLRSLPT